MKTYSNDLTRDAAIREIAKRELFLETLEPTMSGADFREIAVWMAETALKAAYEAGREAGRKTEHRRRTPTRCDCPACGRSIEITPLT